MKVTLVTVGKVKEAYLLAAISEYSKRLSRYIDLKIVEVADEKTDENASEKEEMIVKDIEGKRILEKIPKGDHVIALAINGKMFDSVEMSEHISDLGVRGKSSLTFIIGGSLGLSEEVLERADEKWSFSKLTFPHQLMRVILLEQLYRSFRIMKHEPYHK